MIAIDRLVVATRNEGKLREIAQLLCDLRVQVLSVGDYADAPEVDEPYEAFCDNALRKATEVAFGIGEWTVADDSGLQVHALDGRPGVYSSRVADSDAERIAWLLEEMSDVPADRRQARFVCCIALSSPEKGTRTWHETVEGRITQEPSGSGGFGFDPVFFYPPQGMTFAEMSRHGKGRVSHRGKALAAFRSDFERILDGDESLLSQDGAPR